MSLSCCPDCGNVLERDYERDLYVCPECGEKFAGAYFRKRKMPYKVEGLT